jgi:hypothetical protein
VRGARCQKNAADQIRSALFVDADIVTGKPTPCAALKAFPYKAYEAVRLSSAGADSPACAEFCAEK